MGNFSEQVWGESPERHQKGVGAGALDARALPARLLALVTELRARSPAESARSGWAREAALAAGMDSIDVEYVVPEALADTLPALGALFDALQDYCAADDRPLLTLPPHPDIRRFQQWYLAEVIAQIGGAHPAPWKGQRR